MARAAKSSGSDLSGSPLSVVVITGTESFLKKEKLAEIRSALEEKHGEVETFTYDGKTATLAEVLDELRSFSLMQGYKIVLVDDADVFITGKRTAESDEGDSDDEASEGSPKREALERYTASPVDHATLVLRSTKWNKGKLDKLIEKVGVIIKCDPLGEPETTAWLIKRAEGFHGRKIDPKAARMLAERLPGDLMLLDNELAKLSLLAGEQQTIDGKMVEQLVGRSSEEEAWSVQEAVLAAIASGPKVAIDKIHEVIDLSGQPKILVAYFVADLARKLHHGAQMKARGAGDAEIAAALKLWGPRQNAFMTALRKLDAEKTGRMFDKAVLLDVRSKTGFSEPNRNDSPPRGLECLCVTLTGT